MDSDSSLPIITLIAASAVFGLISTAMAALRSVGLSYSKTNPEDETLKTKGKPGSSSITNHSRETLLLSWLKGLSVFVIGCSFSILAFTSPSSTWYLVVSISSAILIFLGFLHSACQHIGNKFRHKVASMIAPILTPLMWALSPLFQVSQLATQTRSLKIDPSDLLSVNESSSNINNSTFSDEEEDEVRSADAEERRMIRGVLRLEDVSAREIMVPRVDIIAAKEGIGISEIAVLMSEGGHSRVPLYRDTIDNVIGIIHARDVLRNTTSQSGHTDLIDIARPPLFVPDSKPLDQLIQELQDKHVTIAIVVDEYGGTQGVVTMEDLLEEIVGEIEDEFEEGSPAISQINENEAIVDSRVTLDELNSLFHVQVEGDGFDTVGGLLSANLGRIPAVGDIVYFGRLTIRVLSTTGRRARTVRIVRQLE